MLNRPDESISAARKGLDETGGLRRIAQRFPDLVNGPVQAVIEIAGRIRRPDPLPQLFAGDDRSRPLQERNQEFEGLALQLYFAALA